jgi:hypothetical protein
MYASRVMPNTFDQKNLPGFTVSISDSLCWPVNINYTRAFVFVLSTLQVHARLWSTPQRSQPARGTASRVAIALHARVFACNFGSNAGRKRSSRQKLENIEAWV